MPHAIRLIWRQMVRIQIAISAHLMKRRQCWSGRDSFVLLLFLLHQFVQVFATYVIAIVINYSVGFVCFHEIRNTSSQTAVVWIIYWVIWKGENVNKIDMIMRNQRWNFKNFTTRKEVNLIRLSRTTVWWFMLECNWKLNR